jgi:hypothetical protein
MLLYRLFLFKFIQNSLADLEIFVFGTITFNQKEKSLLSQQTVQTSTITVSPAHFNLSAKLCQTWDFSDFSECEVCITDGSLLC